MITLMAVAMPRHSWSCREHSSGAYPRAQAGRQRRRLETLGSCGAGYPLRSAIDLLKRTRSNFFFADRIYADGGYSGASSDGSLRRMLGDKSSGG